MEHMQDLATQNPDRQKEMAKKLEEGKLSIRDWREQIQNVMNLCVAPAPSPHTASGHPRMCGNVDTPPPAVRCQR